MCETTARTLALGRRRLASNSNVNAAGKSLYYILALQTVAEKRNKLSFQSGPLCSSLCVSCGDIYVAEDVITNENIFVTVFTSKMSLHGSRAQL